MPGALILTLEALVMGSAILALFHYRERIGLGPFYVLIGSNQYLQLVLAEQVRVPILGGLAVSPGSAILFTASILVVLLTYIEDDTNATRSLVAGTVIANVIAILFMLASSLQGPVGGGSSNVSLPPFVVGTLLFVVDAICVITLYEFMLRRFRFKPISAVWVSMMLVLVFDTAAFSFFVRGPGYWSQLRGDAAGKVLVGTIYVLGLGAYLKAFPRGRAQASPRTLRDVVTLLSYRQRYEMAAGEAAELKAEIQRRRIELSELKEAEISLKNEMRLARRPAELGRFVSGVAHEVRNPIFGIRANLEAWEQDPQAGFAEYGRFILGETERLQKLMNELIDLGRPGAARMEKMAVDTVVRSAIASCAREAQTRNVRIEERGHPLMIVADANRIEQAVRNLIENALAFSPSGSTIFVHWVPFESGVSIEVKDAGPGFSRDDIHRVFEPFFTKRRQGTGLGLALVKSIAEEHGGEAWARNDLDHGAEVGFSIVSLRAENP